MRSRVRDDDSFSTVSTFSTLTTIYSRANETVATRRTLLDRENGYLYNLSVKELLRRWTTRLLHRRNRRIILYSLSVCILFTSRMRIHDFFTWIDPFNTSYEYTIIETKDLAYVATSNPDFDAMQPPPGYPFHRWSEKRKHIGMTGYPLNEEKFVHILNKLGKGEQIQTSLEEGLKYERSFRDFIRISGSGAQPYIIRRGKVLRPFGSYRRWSVYKWHHQGHHIDWVTLLESAVSMAKALETKNPRMKLITQGEFPIIFDEFDYPWCADDMVPIFRLSAIVDPKKCTHQWPSLSLNYILPQRSQWLKDDPSAWDAQHLEFDEEYPWEEKLPKAVWRGRYTGYRIVYDRGILPREQLVLLASNHRDNMDIHPVSSQYRPDGMTGELIEKSADQIPFKDFMKYRAIVDIDSNGASTRFGPLLCMNSVIIKVQPKFGSYWNDELEPWVHYIPAESDLSDLKVQVDFAVSNKHQKQVKQIIHNANAWCRAKMTWEQHTLDFLWTLLDYAELLDKSPTFNEKWTGDRFAYRLPNLEMARFEGELTV